MEANEEDDNEAAYVMSTVEAINNLATSAESDKKTITELTRANVLLTKTNAELTKSLSKLDILLGINKTISRLPSQIPCHG